MDHHALIREIVEDRDSFVRVEAGRNEEAPLYLGLGPLAAGIEKPQGIDLISKKLDPHGLRQRRREDVDDGTSLRVFPLFPDKGGRLVARLKEIVDKLFLKDGLAELHLEGALHEETGRKKRLIERCVGKKADEGLIGCEVVEEAYPFRLVFLLEDPVTVHRKIEDLLLREELDLFLQEQGLVFVVVEDDDLPVLYLGEKERDKRLDFPRDVDETALCRPIHGISPKKLKEAATSAAQSIGNYTSFTGDYQHEGGTNLFRER